MLPKTSLLMPGSRTKQQQHHKSHSLSVVTNVTKKSQLVPNEQDSGGIPLKTRQRLELYLNPGGAEALVEAEHHRAAASPCTNFPISSICLCLLSACVYFRRSLWPCVSDERGKNFQQSACFFFLTNQHQWRKKRDAFHQFCCHKSALFQSRSNAAHTSSHYSRVRRVSAVMSHLPASSPTPLFLKTAVTCRREAASFNSWRAATTTRLGMNSSHQDE